MPSSIFLMLLTKYGSEPEVFLTPDQNSIAIVDSVLGRLVFEGTRGAPFETSEEFMSQISAKTGLEVQNVSSRGGDCFYHAFWVAYYGYQPTRDDITRLRHCIACRIWSKWSDFNFRSMVSSNEDYAEFREPSSGDFDLALFLSGVANEKEADYQLYADGLFMELVAEIFNCVIVVVSAKTEGSLSRIVLGPASNNQFSVYVAWNGRESSAHYFAFLGNPEARVVKWAEFSPSAMIGSEVHVERSPDRMFIVCINSLIISLNRIRPWNAQICVQGALGQD